MKHLAAFYSSLTGAGTLAALAAVSDQAIRTDGNDLVIPSNLANLGFEAALSDADTSVDYAQVQSPSLRQLANQDVLPVVSGVVFGANPAVQEHMKQPRGLRGNESLNFYVQAKATGDKDNYGLIILQDGPAQPVTGAVFSVRATAAAANSAGSWINSALTFDSTLPAGTYNVVGMRAQGAGLVAARLVFVGQAYRPGVPAVNATGDQDFLMGRFGRMGSFGTFDVNQPPTIDCIGSSGAAQTVVLDLIKIS